jgi:hypothetical protein
MSIIDLLGAALQSQVAIVMTGEIAIAGLRTYASFYL